MRVLIIGASGLIGGAILVEFSDHQQTMGTYNSFPVEGLTRVDISDLEAIRRLTEQFGPQVILQPAALTHVNYCESHPDECWRINVDGTRSIAEAASRLGARHVFFSTEYVFDGTAGPYSEEDPPNPVSVYGRHKLAAEDAIRQVTNNHLIIRTTAVYGWERQGNNFVVRLLRGVREGKRVAVPTDQITSPTYAPNLAQAVRELVESDACGIYNVAGPDIVDRYSFAVATARIFGFPIDLIKPVVTTELNQAARRPLRAGLKVDKAQRKLSTSLQGVEAGLTAMREEQPR